MHHEHYPRYAFPLTVAEMDMTRLAIPAPVALKFRTLRIRLHNDPDLDGFAYLTATVPRFKDDEGYVWEMEFLSDTDENGASDGYTVNSFPKDAVSLREMPNLLDVRLEYEPHEQRAKGYLMLKAKVEGTSYRGGLLLEEAMFDVG